MIKHKTFNPQPKPFNPLFQLGDVFVTPAASDAIGGDILTVTKLLDRHISGDWGDVCEEDWNLNNESLEDNNRLMSVYALPDETKIWVITEWDRSVTTILLPEDY